MNHAIETHGLTKHYSGFDLQDVSLRVPEGYVTGLVGPNGAGKTTIIKLLMNLVRRDGGSVRMLGLDLPAEEVAVKQRIGFVYDEPCFPAESSLTDIKRMIAPFYDGWDEPHYRSLVERFELPLDRRFKKLSHGMQMKFALAIALSHHADLLILDEPTAGLDPVFRRELLGHLAALLQDERKTVLFSTHVTSDLERIADYVTVVAHGQLLVSLPKDELLECWGVVRGGEELLLPEHRHLFRGFRRREVAVEALTCDRAAVPRRIKGPVVVDPAKLEDVLYFLTRGGNHAQPAR